MRGFLIQIFIFSNLLVCGQKAWMEVDTNQCLIAEPINISILLKGSDFPTDSLAYDWDMDSLTQQWTVLQSSDVDTIIENKGWLIERKYQITAYDTGYLIVPPFQIEFSDTTVASNAVLVRVDYPGIDVNKDIEPVGEVLEAPFQFSEIQDYFIFGGILLIILLTVLWVVWKYVLPRFKKASTPEVPEIPVKEVVWKRITQLEKEHLWVKGKTKQHHFEFSEILRLMLDDLYQLKTMESTSNELLGQLSKTSFPKPLFRKLKEILAFSDLVKFAKVQGEDYRHEQTIDLLKEIFETYKSREVDEGLE